MPSRERSEASAHRYLFHLNLTVRRALGAVGLSAPCWVDVDDENLQARFGPWVLTTPIANVKSAQVTGPYRPWRVLGARLSLADRGLTFGTTTARGACIEFHRNVKGIDPFALIEHPAITVTVEDPQALVNDLHRRIGVTPIK